jgi:ribonuclease P protein component
LPPEDRRLRKKADFDKLFKSGRKIDRPNLRLLYVSGTGKAAVVVARSAGCIAYRNTVRRRWREALRICEGNNAFDCVIVVKAEGAKDRGDAIKKSIREALASLPH